MYHSYFVYKVLNPGLSVIILDFGCGWECELLEDFLSTSDDLVFINGTGFVVFFITILLPLVLTGAPDRKSSMSLAINVHLLPSKPPE